MRPTRTWIVVLGMVVGLSWGLEARAQVPSGPATGGGSSWGAYANPIPPGSNPYATAYANPYMNPAANLYVNPYFAATTDPGAGMLLSMLAAQRAGNGIGSGKLGGPRAGEAFGMGAGRPSPTAHSGAPMVETVGPRYYGRGARSYFQRPMVRGDRGSRYYQRSLRR